MMQTLSDFSYWLVALGSTFEGEVTLALASLAAERGLMKIAWVVVAAAAGAFVGDQVTFLSFRWFGSRVMERFPGLATRTGRIRGVLARQAVPAIFVTRFLWGFRMPAYATLANSGIAYPVFLVVNAVACIAWASVIGTLAFAFSHSVMAVIGRATEIREIGLEAAALMAVLALILLLVRWLIGRRKAVQEG